jgi:hypothetical protein
MRAEKTKPLAVLRTLGCAMHTSKRVGVVFQPLFSPERIGKDDVFFPRRLE